MKILVPVDASEAALAPLSYLESLARSGVRFLFSQARSE